MHAADPTAPPGVPVCRENEPDMPEESRRFLFERSRYEHVENDGNPLVEGLGLDLPDHLANRRFL